MLAEHSLFFFFPLMQTRKAMAGMIPQAVLHHNLSIISEASIASSSESLEQA